MKDTRHCRMRGLAAALATALLPCPSAHAEEILDRLGLGGEIRELYEFSRHPVFGLDQPARDGRVLQRLFLHSDVQLGSSSRAYVELVSGLTGGWGGKASPQQDDRLDVLQAYGETRFDAAGHALGLRLGRQELSFGSSRLVSVREGPNVRRSFDGARATWAGAAESTVDVFLVRPVNPLPGSFNDRSDNGQAFWGVYASAIDIGLRPLKADLYYLGLNRDQARFASGSAQEHRQTAGARLFGKEGAQDWNFEGAYQFGSFGDQAIRAWTLSSDAGYTAAGLPMAPRFGLKLDAVSGDHDPRDGRLNTFNALFPKLPYFSEANVAAPANLLDLQPSVTVKPRRDLHVTLGWNGLWKQSRADGFYAPALTPVAGTPGQSSRHIGQQWLASAEWAATAALSFGANYVHFRPGAALHAAGARSGDFVNLYVQARF